MTIGRRPRVATLTIDHIRSPGYASQHKLWMPLPTTPSSLAIQMLNRQLNRACPGGGHVIALISDDASQSGWQMLPANSANEIDTIRDKWGINTEYEVYAMRPDNTLSLPTE